MSNPTSRKGDLLLPLTNLLADLVSIDSVNPTLVEGGAGESAMADYVQRWMSEAGLDVERYDVEPGRPNVIGTRKGSGGGRTLVLNCHMDTVGVSDMPDAHSPRVVDGLMYPTPINKTITIPARVSCQRTWLSTSVDGV